MGVNCLPKSDTSAGIADKVGYEADWLWKADKSIEEIVRLKLLRSLGEAAHIQHRLMSVIIYGGTESWHSQSTSQKNSDRRTSTQELVRLHGYRRCSGSGHFDTHMELATRRLAVKGRSGIDRFGCVVFRLRWIYYDMHLVAVICMC